jgi:protein-disulfide isomerase
MRKAGMLVLLCGLCLPAAMLWADELFSATEVTRAWTIHGVEGASLGADEKAFEAWFAVEPAAGGHGEEPAKKEGESPAAGHETSGNEKAGEGSEGGHSASGGKKEKEPEFPHVTIGGEDVLTHVDLIARETSNSVPAILKKQLYVDILGVRMVVNTYAHTPQRGDRDARIKVVEFADLGCSKCIDTLREVDADLKPYENKISLAHVYAPSVEGMGTNMAAFYGKLAERTGKFWEYRQKVMEAKPSTVEATLDILMQLGISEMEARSMLMTESRRFYREMDADTLLARSLGTGNTPTIFINGIRVGGEGIPIDKLPEVMEYVESRIKNNLPEPPQ